MATRKRKPEPQDCEECEGQEVVECTSCDGTSCSEDENDHPEDEWPCDGGCGTCPECTDGDMPCPLC